MRWVKLTLAPVVRNSWLLTMVRLTSSSLAGTTRTLVAVGTLSDASMLATIRAAAPRKGATSSRSSSFASGAGWPGGADEADGADGVAWLAEGIAARVAASG